MCRNAPLATATTQAHRTTPATHASSQLSALLFTDGRTQVPVTDYLDPGVDPGEKGTLRFCVKVPTLDPEQTLSLLARPEWRFSPCSFGWGGLSAYVCFAPETQASIWLTGGARQVEANKRAARRGR